MPLKESGEMYLETIYVLCEKGASVRSIDVAEYMSFSKPSVSRAVKNLKDGGFIFVDGNGFISLTDVGEEVARKIYERHEIISAWLIDIGVDEKLHEMGAKDGDTVILCDFEFDFFE